MVSFEPSASKAFPLDLLRGARIELNVGGQLIAEVPLGRHNIGPHLANKIISDTNEITKLLFLLEQKRMLPLSLHTQMKKLLPMGATCSHTVYSRGFCDCWKLTFYVANI